MDDYDFYVVLVNMFYSSQEIDEKYIDVWLNILTIMIYYTLLKGNSL
jgi:hypothetical protein